MKRIIGTLALGAMLAMTVAAVAEETTATIKAINTTTRQITMEDGKIYTALGSIDLTKIKAGDKVKVTYDVATPVFVSLGIFGSATKIAAAN